LEKEDSLAVDFFEVQNWEVSRYSFISINGLLERAA